MNLKSQKTIDVILLVFAAIIGFFASQLFNQIISTFNISVPGLEDSPVSLGAMLAIVLGLILFVVARRSKKVNTFLEEVVQEFTKVTWPTRKETVLSTGVVTVMIAFSSVLVFLFDVLWASLTKSLLGS